MNVLAYLGNMNEMHRLLYFLDFLGHSFHGSTDVEFYLFLSCSRHMTGLLDFLAFLVCMNHIFMPEESQI